MALRTADEDSASMVVTAVCVVVIVVVVVRKLAKSNEDLDRARRVSVRQVATALRVASKRDRH